MLANSKTEGLSSEAGRHVRTVLSLIDDCRLLAADNVLDEIKSSLDGNALETGTIGLMTQEECRVTRHLLNSFGDVLSTNSQRAALVRDVISSSKVDLLSEGQKEWADGGTMFGVKTHYKTAPSGCVTVLSEGGQMDVPIFEQMAVLKEAALLKHYVPFCSDSSVVHKVSETEVLGYFNVNMFPTSRDTCVHAFGVDCLREFGCIVLIGKSVQEWPGVEMPFKPAGLLHQQMSIEDYTAIINVTSPTSAQTRLLFTVDPKVRPKMENPNMCSHISSGHILM
jgi:hypothetical protein